MDVSAYIEAKRGSLAAHAGQVTDIALQPGEQLVGSGPVAAGDTVRWIIGDTESGSGAASNELSQSDSMRASSVVPSSTNSVPSATAMSVPSAIPSS